MQDINPIIVVGDYTYIADSEFESHVTNFYPWSRDLEKVKDELKKRID